jgi:tripartite ATP-independent transporter DctM subunit
MTGVEFGALMILAVLAAMALGMPVGIAMLVLGGVGFAHLAGADRLFSFLNDAPLGRVSNFNLIVIPLFVLMGEFATKAGMSQGLFRAANAWFGHVRGGLAIATIGGCAGFGAICGSSIATGATMAKVCLPEMKRYRYSDTLATGSLAAGGTLGILIPPSIILVIYAILVEQSIAELFVAAFVPGVLAALLYMVAIAIYVRLKPDAGPAGGRAPPGERLASLGGVWPIAALFLLVVGGLYGGLFTANEAAAAGAAGAGILAFAQGGMRWRGFVECLLGTGRTSAMIFLILIGAEVYNAFLARTRLPIEAADMVSALQVSPLAVVVVMLLIYLALGCVMDSLAMILLTVPVFYPVVMSLDLGIPPDEVAIWFGILALIAVEVGLITPPFGLNVFVINAMAERVPLTDTFKGVMPFLVTDFVRVALLLAFPAIALWLPRTV